MILEHQWVIGEMEQELKFVCNGIMEWVDIHLWQNNEMEKHVLLIPKLVKLMLDGILMKRVRIVLHIVEQIDLCLRLKF